jgi:integrase/recombinase XerD
LCPDGITESIKMPRVYKLESLPYSPSWDEVKKLFKTTENKDPINIRDLAILMLLAIYGFRCSEVAELQLNDIDWENKILNLRRAKNSKPQKFPLCQTVGKAIINYLTQVRPKNSSCREVFLCIKAPYRPLSNAAIYRLVSHRWKLLGVSIKHIGPHSLRHACATRLINEGLSLKEISHYLGHQWLETTRIYTKVDLNNLRKVTDFNIGGLL